MTFEAKKLHSLVDSYFKTPENSKRQETASDKLSSIYSKHRKSAGHLISVHRLKVSSYDNSSDENNATSSPAGGSTPAANSANFSRISRSIIKKPSFAIN